MPNIRAFENSTPQIAPDVWIDETALIIGDVSNSGYRKASFFRTMNDVTSTNLFDTAARCLDEPDPTHKVALTRQAAADWRSGRLSCEQTRAGPVSERAGRPQRLKLVPPRQLVSRKLATAEGRAAMIHAVVHIEFNAINLAWDAVQRFRTLPQEFYADWVRIAAEEADHFESMRQRLNDLGYDYGDFPAHNGLWEMACRTAADPLARMALVPRVLEARGLDVTPGMIMRFEGVGDSETAERLRLILREEVGHVAAGSRWFRMLCDVRGLAPYPCFFRLIGDYMTGEIRCPLNLIDRQRAGFEPEELEQLQALCSNA